MSALDLLLITHSHKCNKALLDGKPCICGCRDAALEVERLREELEILRAFYQKVLNKNVGEGGYFMAFTLAVKDALFETGMKLMKLTQKHDPPVSG
jgi:hypothetical protein